MIARTVETPIRVGIAGLGRSGWNIHAKTLAAMRGRYRVVSVVDAVADRRAEAEREIGCRAYDEFDALLRDESVELIVIATPNHLHTQHAVAALEAGKHVVCEKPFALTLEDADAMVAAADRTGRLLSPFQNRRYEPHFRKVCDVIDSGVLGDVVMIRLAWHQFSRRWDWQTLARFGGGLLGNNGSHLIDHALQLLGDEVEPEDLDIAVDLKRVLTLGDTEDHVKVMIQAEGRPTIDVELTSTAAFEQDRWFIMGSAGGLRGTLQRLEWRTVDWNRMPERRLDPRHAQDRIYQCEEIPWQTHEWRLPADAPREYGDYYMDLYESIRDGQPLVISGESVRSLIAVVDRCYDHIRARQLASALR